MSRFALAAAAAVVLFASSASPAAADSYLFERSYYSHAPAKPVEVTPRVPLGGPQFTRPQGFAAQGMVRWNYSRIVVRGRMNLLVPGVGFNHALSGRENIVLGGLASGLTPQRLDELSESIAEFAELGEYLDYPIKTYSSGMKSRLGFAVAAHLDPDILLIDEALSAGDSAFAEKAGLDADLVLDVISKGAAQSWQMENRGKTMHARKFDFGFAVDWMRKDLGIAMAEAKRNGAKLPVTEIVAKFYDEISKNGGNRWDTSSLITRL